MVDLDTLLEKSDYVTLHVPLTDQTRHMIGEKELSKMKPTAYLINCARGGVVDETALYNALKEGKIAGAAFDVFETEPPGENPLFTLPNFICTPHIGASTKEGQGRVGEEIVKLMKEMI